MPNDRATPAPLRPDARVVTAAFLLSGVLHVVRPRTYEPLMPAWVPAHREVIVGSGVAELACAAGVLHPRTRRAAAWAGAALLVAVLPGNVQMAQDAWRRRHHRHGRLWVAGTTARLPLQVPMVRAMVRAAREAG